MKKYNDEHFTVRERRTHKKICDCGSFEDARMMMHLDGPNREIVKNKALMSPVVDVEMPKGLPTTNITATNTQENGCAPRKEQLLDAGILRLPKDQRIPVNAK